MALRFPAGAGARAGTAGAVEVGAYLPFLDAPPPDGLRGWAPADAIGEPALRAHQASLEEALGARVPGAALSRVYVGTECCERRLPSRRALAGWVRAAADAGVPVTLVLPPLGPGTLEAGLARAEQLSDAAGAEVVANDWGTVHALRSRLPTVTLCLGRLTQKIVRDPRLAPHFDAPDAPPAARDALCRSGESAPGWRRILARYGVARRETDPYLQPIADAEWEGRDERVSLHLPYLFVTAGRACVLGGLGRERRDKFVPGGDCGSECRTVAVELELSTGPGADGPVRLVSFGNALYHAVPRAVAERHLDALPARPRLDRLVVLVPVAEGRA